MVLKTRSHRKTKGLSDDDSYLSSKSEQDRVRRRLNCLEPVNLIFVNERLQSEYFRRRIYFDGLCIKLEPILVDQELLDVLTLISLQLNHLAHFTVIHDGAIASCAASVVA
jgi:hypothetical protein